MKSNYIKYKFLLCFSIWAMFLVNIASTQTQVAKAEPAPSTKTPILIAQTTSLQNYSKSPSNIKQQCLSAITGAKNKLENGRQLKITSSSISDVSSSDHPQNRPDALGFTMQGASVGSVLTSPVFMNSIAEKVINNCNSISMVTFGVNGTDEAETFGLMPNQKVQLFECPSYIEDIYTHNYKWGEACSG
ncbi:MAG: hypothetical protein RLZZ381_2801 [Cyanobacteriota bacterium]|jgi:hypothetical protein